MFPNLTKSTNFLSASSRPNLEEEPDFIYSKVDYDSFAKPNNVNPMLWRAALQPQ